MTTELKLINSIQSFPLSHTSPSLKNIFCVQSTFSVYLNVNLKNLHKEHTRHETNDLTLVL